MGSRNGIATEKIKALLDYATSPLFSDAEKIALEYADATIDTNREVDDGVVCVDATTLRRRHHRGADDDHRVGKCVLALQGTYYEQIIIDTVAQPAEVHGS